MELGPETREMFEQVTEAVHEVKEELEGEKAGHKKADHKKEHAWLNLIGLSTGILAAMAAIAAMQAGHLANEAMLTQVQAANQWNYFQSKSTKRHVAQSTVTILETLNQKVPAKTISDIDKLQTEQKEIKDKAEELENESHVFLEQHVTFSRGVTALQISISLGAVAVLLRRKEVWFSSLGLAAVGVFFTGSGFLAGMTPVHPVEAAAAESGSHGAPAAPAAHSSQPSAESHSSQPKQSH
jgi:FtsZ-binding cell division protein ZapB